ncbi:unnamed protein product [Photorhabdus laumondii subsp. laumondii TTO1]|uniref:Photorhabdus luminescens subsp. laumondii TTO1 complete genome segment 17/17 n=1 Tax=Photorhabdus laumondii subsp. laumondii (strain DSM 15139 / CIP 105565 / TT01) TaxID=243265 RepID=Q7MY21_PHOLL|nr:unnamed protein product [Photorhabdus laumondii subsp. laumondii TTO1]
MNPKEATQKYKIHPTFTNFFQLCTVLRGLAFAWLARVHPERPFGRPRLKDRSFCFNASFFIK